MREINYCLLQLLADKPHPLLHIAEDVTKQVLETPMAWTAEVFTQARTAHHLLDMMGVPQQAGGHYSSDLDARVWLAADMVVELRSRLDRLSTWHSQETAGGGMVGSRCRECGLRWPCPSRRMADGTDDPNDDNAGY